MSHGKMAKQPVEAGLEFHARADGEWSGWREKSRPANRLVKPSQTQSNQARRFDRRIMSVMSKLGP